MLEALVHRLSNGLDDLGSGLDALGFDEDLRVPVRDLLVGLGILGFGFKAYTSLEDVSSKPEPQVSSSSSVPASFPSEVLLSAMKLALRTQVAALDLPPIPAGVLKTVKALGQDPTRAFAYPEDDACSSTRIGQTAAGLSVCTRFDPTAVPLTTGRIQDPSRVYLGFYDYVTPSPHAPQLGFYCDADDAKCNAGFDSLNGRPVDIEGYSCAFSVTGYPVLDIQKGRFHGPQTFMRATDGSIETVNTHFLGIECEKPSAQI